MHRVARLGVKVGMAKEIVSADVDARFLVDVDLRDFFSYLKSRVSSYARSMAEFDDAFWEVHDGWFGVGDLGDRTLLMEMGITEGIAETICMQSPLWVHRRCRDLALWMAPEFAV